MFGDAAKQLDHLIPAASPPWTRRRIKPFSITPTVNSLEVPRRMEMNTGAPGSGQRPLLRRICCKTRKLQGG